MQQYLIRNGSSTIPSHTSIPANLSHSHSMTTQSQNNIFKRKRIFTATKHDILQNLEPSTVTQTLKILHWRKACLEEFDALLHNGTWSLVPGDDSKNVVGCEWLFHIKRNSDGKGDVESYLDWEIKVDQALAYFDYHDYEKALVWGNQFCKEIREGRRRHADTCVDLKRELRSSFVLASYAKDLGPKAWRDIEVALTRANVLEFNEATKAHFLHGLNRDI
ncbi:putative mitochondrial protein, partial [Mucuna pruriens]